MLSDKVAHRTPHRKQGKGWYTDSQKLEAVKLYLVCGNLTATAAALNIKFETIRLWKKSKWWAELTEEIQREGHIQLSQKLKNIASKALDITVDRLENGDWQYDPKTGGLIRKPVLMRDAHRVASDLLEKHIELEGKPVRDEDTKATQDRLEALAQTFAGFARKVKRIEVLDVEPIHAKEIRTISQEAG